MKPKVYKYSREIRERMSEAQRGIKKPRPERLEISNTGKNIHILLTCQYCGKTEYFSRHSSKATCYVCKILHQREATNRWKLAKNVIPNSSPKKKQKVKQ